MAFTQVAGLHPKRHFFDKSFVYKTTMKFGQLIPFLAEEVISGDKYKIGNNAVVRVSPMVAPILDNIYLRTEYFFVPERLLSDDDSFSKFMSGGKDGDYTTYPFGELVAEGDMEFEGSLSDYFGLPKHYKTLTDDDDINVKISDKFHRAYIKVWNEFYRDENLQEEVGMSNIAYDMHPLRRAWKKDYFTSALLSPQRGTAPAIPIVGTIPVTGTSSHVKYGDLVNETAENIRHTDVVTNPTAYFGRSFDGTTRGSVIANSLNIENLKGSNFLFSTADDSGASFFSYLDSDPNNMNLVANITPQSGLTFNASDVRKLMQIQKFMERNMRAGVRFNEFLLAHFGVAPRDEVLQRPRFLGSTKTPILISEVLQTSQSTSDSPQGRLSGKGLGLSAGMIGTHTFEEPGIILGLASIMPDLSYQSQGINKKFTRFTRYDYYFPEFAHLSEQPIKKYELYFDDTDDDELNKNHDTFGYQGIYDDMRHNRDMVTGQFRSDVSASLDYWHLARKFQAPPALNSNFIECNPSNRIFEVQDEPPFQVCIGNILKAIRPMPKIAEPGFVDHF